MEKLDINKQVPYGASLQEVLDHPSLNESKIKYFLRFKGVFIENSKPNDTYPILLSTLISPNEFEYIKEHIRTKEANQKIQSRTIEWHDRRDLIEIVPDSIDLKKMVEESGARYKVIKQTNFATVDGDRNKVKMTFKCETNNYNSGWYRTKNEYDGEILVEKTGEGDEAYLRMIYTSPETMNIADIGVKYLAKEFKDKKYTKPDKDIERTLYGNFTNEERVSFFMSLTGANDVFTFQRFTNVDIAPDKTKDLPAEVHKLMTGNVNSLNIDGENLHENFLLRERENHQFVELADIEARYDFSYHVAEGSCIVRFGFSKYLKKRLHNIEFSIDISSISLKDEYQHLNKEKIRSYLLQEFEKFKTEKYNQIKKQRE